MSDGFLEEFRAFVGFLQSLWGVLAGVSALFPLSNLLFRVVPTDPEVIWALSFIVDPRALLTTVATIGSLFVLLWTFGQRYRFGDRPRRRLHRVAWVSFGGAVVLLVGYLVLYAIAAAGDHELLIGSAGSATDLPIVLYELVMLLVYVGVFALMTRSFVLLGLVEYLDVQE